MSARRLAILLAAAAAVAVAAAVVWRGPWRDRLRDLAGIVRELPPHERYLRRLRDAGLHETALGREWIQAADRALREPTTTGLPFRESLYFDPARPGAVAYAVDLERGHRLDLAIELEAAEPGLVFVDVFRLEPDAAPGERPQRVASGEAGTRSVTFEPRKAGRFAVRLQPELLRGGRVTITQRAEAALRVPVAGVSAEAFRSGFGASRDGGRRTHEGVDVFAPRGTAVLAASDGFVTRVGSNTLGGRVVWVWDPARQLLQYYAHLDRQDATAGTRVRAGDAIGTVGNTGNARTTQPHLHFGLYEPSAGAVDPDPFVRPNTARPPAPASVPVALGDRARIARGPTPLRAAPASGGEEPPDSLANGTIVRVVGASAEWARVELPDGTTGFVAPRRLEALRPTTNLPAPDGVELRERPHPAAAVMVRVSDAGRLEVLGHFNDYVLVRAPSGHAGWVRPL